MFEFWETQDLDAGRVEGLARLLAQVSADDALALPADAAEALVAATQRVANAALGLQAVAIEALARREREVLDADPAPSSFGPVDEWEFVADRVAPLLHMTGRGAEDRVDLARTLGRRLPLTLSAMRSGQLDLYRASVIAAEVSCAHPAVAAEVEEQMFPDALALASTKLRALARRTMSRVDPASVRERARRARSDRMVWLRPGDEPGVTRWQADQPTEISVLAWAAIDELAHRYVADGEHRTLDQARADAMLDLILGNAQVTTTVELAVSVATDPDTVGVNVPGIGFIPEDVVTALTTACDTPLRRLLLDPDTGAVLQVGTSTYRPSERLRRAVRKRDRTCRFPSCAVKAERCDLDHVVTFPRGPTTESNLVVLCRHHHRLKHHAGWSLTMTPQGVCTWTTPSGLEYVTDPFDYRTLAA